MDSIPFAAAIGAIVATGLYIYHKKVYGYWKRQGISGPAPIPFFGNVLQHAHKVIHEFDYENRFKYGKLFGIYEGRKPVLVCCDPEVFRHVLVKDFNLFADRTISGMNLGHYLAENQLDILSGEEWKKVRTVINPAFSTGKIKRMFPLFNEALDNLLERFEKDAANGKSVNARLAFGAYAIDAIARVAFATKLKSLDDPENPFVVNGAKVFSQKKLDTIMMNAGIPWPSNFFDFDALKWFENFIGHMIQTRRADTKGTHNDFLQMLFDAQQSEKGQCLTDDIMAAQLFSFLGGAFETVAQTLMFLTFLLVQNQDAQSKLYEEIKANITEKDLHGSNSELYEKVGSLPYLDAALDEALRLYPTFPRFVNRKALEDYTIPGYNVKVPKGGIVICQAYVVQRDPEYYPDPHEFRPERFLPENKGNIVPYTHIPFGDGPRMCVGMRLGQMMSKIAMVRVLSEFKLVRAAETPEKLEFVEGTDIFIYPKKPIVFALEKRVKAAA